MALLTETKINEAAKKAKSKAFKYWLSIQKPEYANSFRVYEPSEELYHVSNDSEIKNFFPKIPNVLKEDEDNTIPRICTSTTILDALIGMVDTSSVSRLGARILTVYRFKPQISVRPTKKALPNISELNERWIVGYDPTRTDYSSDKVADIWVDSISRIVNDELTIIGYLLPHDDVVYHNTKVAKGLSDFIEFSLTLKVKNGDVEVLDVVTQPSNRNWFEIIGAR